MMGTEVGEGADRESYNSKLDLKFLDSDKISHFLNRGSKQSTS